jgi:AbrB family looped-hinge helix DNA binding protein
MATKPSTKVGKRGTVVIPAATRRRYGIDEGTVLIVAERDDGILLQPVALVPIETYSRERKAEFLLSNAVDAADYAQAVNDVRDLGLDPDLIPHAKPADNGSDAD